MNDREKGVQTQSQGPTWPNKAMITHIFYGERAVPGEDLFKTVNLDTKGDTRKKKDESSYEKLRVKNMHKL